jgi:hypothetical protein
VEWSDIPLVEVEYTRYTTYIKYPYSTFINGISTLQLHNCYVAFGASYILYTYL